MNQEQHGGPAFPGISHSFADNEVVGGHVQSYTALSTYEGMSLRDYFAAKAMQSLMSLDYKEKIRKITQRPLQSRLRSVSQSPPTLKQMPCSKHAKRQPSDKTTRTQGLRRPSGLTIKHHE